MVRPECTPISFRIIEISALVLITGLVAFSRFSFDGPVNEGNNMITELPLSDRNNSETFQELGFFSPVKRDKWNEFLRSVQNNISHSRNEPGNICFALYQPENGVLQPLWFERFKNKTAHSYHKKQNYFKTAIQVIQQSLEGEACSVELKTLTEVPVIIPIAPANPSLTRHVITLFDVRPNKRQLFIEMMAAAMSKCRKAPGNLEYNIYCSAEEPAKFFLVEGWNTSANHGAYLSTKHSQRLTTATNGFLTSNSPKARWLLADISQ